jgi:alpha-methylacyl-CoA racemase
MAGPLSGVMIVEIAGIGPGPFCGMMLADHGAEVIRVERPGADVSSEDPMLRSRKSIVLDLKNSADIEKCRALCRRADGLIEGFRPGVMERLGLGPELLLKDNPRLVYGRITGWGQDGPLAPSAGHDINYIAVSGVLGACGRAGEKPTPPINLLGDFGGGGLMLAFGMVSALLAVRAGKPGQVIDCAITDGSALLMTMIWGNRASGRWRDARGTNLLDTGAPFYDCYQTADGGFIALGAIEPQFYRELREVLGIEEDPLFDAQRSHESWREQKERLAEIFMTRTRQEWSALFDGHDACFAPVLTMEECPRFKHNAQRSTFIDVGGVVQPAPAPRYSVTTCDVPTRPVPLGD